MTVSDRFSPGGDDFGRPAYPTAFGITFTPTINGILIGLLGVAVAGWMAMTWVGPKFTEMNEVRDRIAQKEQKLQQQQQTVQDIQKIVARVNQAKARNAEVRGLFSSQQALDTLLLDLNRIIVSSKAELQKFTPDYSTSGVLTDSSLGTELNNKLKRQVTDVAFEGTFSQTLEIMRTIDRLQTVIVLRDLKMELKPENTSPQSTAPKNIVTSSFKLYAYVPLTDEELVPAAKSSAATNTSNGNQPPQPQ